MFLLSPESGQGKASFCFHLITCFSSLIHLWHLWSRGILSATYLVIAFPCVCLHLQVGRAAWNTTNMQQKWQVDVLLLVYSNTCTTLLVHTAHSSVIKITPDCIDYAMTRKATICFKILGQARTNFTLPGLYCAHVHVCILVWMIACLNCGYLQ